jgi:hypothetical protein
VSIARSDRFGKSRKTFLFWYAGLAAALTLGTTYGASGVDDQGNCCVALTGSTVLGPPPGNIDLGTGRIDVSVRLGTAQIIADLASTTGDVSVVSDDAGNTWHREPSLDAFRRARAHSRRPGSVVPWHQTVDDSVRYRTLYLPERQARAERSTDAGRSWTPMQFRLRGVDLRLSGCGIPSYHPTNALILYCAAAIAGAQSQSGVYVSNDGGDTFQFMHETAPMARTGVSPPNPDILYGSGINGSVLKSIDAGRTWSLVGQNDLLRKTYYREATKPGQTPRLAEVPTAIHEIAIDPTDPDRVYIASSKGLLRTIDGGQTWCIMNVGIQEADSMYTLVVAPGHPNTIVLGTARGVFRSTDYGCHWTHVPIRPS